MAAQGIVVGGTYTWPATILKDGVAWNLTAATVKLYFWPGDLSVAATAVTADATSATTGIVSVTNPTTTFDRTGAWFYAWKIIDGGIRVEQVPVTFGVARSLSALA